MALVMIFSYGKALLELAAHILIILECQSQNGYYNYKNDCYYFLFHMKSPYTLSLKNIQAVFRIQLLIENLQNC